MVMCRGRRLEPRREDVELDERISSSTTRSSTLVGSSGSGGTVHTGRPPPVQLLAKLTRLGQTTSSSRGDRAAVAVLVAVETRRALILSAAGAMACSTVAPVVCVYSMTRKPDVIHRARGSIARLGSSTMQRAMATRVETEAPQQQRTQRRKAQRTARKRNRRR
jgi:hypothetical protein